MSDRSNTQPTRMLVRDHRGGRDGEISEMVRGSAAPGCTPATFTDWADAARAAQTGAYDLAIVDLEPIDDPREVRARIKTLRRSAPKMQIVAVHREPLQPMEADLRMLGVADVAGGDELTGAVLRRSIRIANERIRITRELRQLERRKGSNRTAADILAEVRHGVIGVNAEGRIVFANAAAARMFGSASDELPGTPVLGLIDVTHRSRVARVLERSRGGHTSGGTECRLGGGHHLSAWVALHVAPWRRSGSDETGSLLVAHDIGERQAVRPLGAQDNEEGQAALAAILDTLPVGILIADAEGQPKLVNSVARDLLGMNALLPVSRWPAMEFIHSAEGAPIQAQDLPILRTLEDGLPRREIQMQVGRPGTMPVPVLVNTSATKDERGILIEVCCTFTNITEQKHIEDQLYQAQKISEISGLVGGVAHDFNNMLCAIMGYADLLESCKEDPERTAHLAKEIRKAGDRAAVMTRQLLAFSRREAQHARVFDINNTVEDMEDLLRRLINADIRLVTELDRSLPNIRGDTGRIGQVLLNLAVNARDAMPAGGDLHVSTRCCTLQARELDGDPSVEAGEYVCLTVRDTGVGMDQDVLTRIFEPFFTTKTRAQGTGLGLSTVYDIVRKSGGHIRVESELGGGTNFVIYFPAVREDAAPVVEVSAPLPVVTGDRETVLLVEDEPMVRVLLREILELSHYVVLEAANGRQALELCAQHGESIGALITDVVMPGMSGRELAERIMSLYPRIPVLYVSGYTDDALLRYGISSGEIPFLQKPFVPGELTHLLRKVIEQPRRPRRGTPPPGKHLRSA